MTHSRRRTNSIDSASYDFGPGDISYPSYNEKYYSTVGLVNGA